MENSVKKRITEIFTPSRAALAPLAGVTDSVFRRICSAFGASPVVTEMVSADGFVRNFDGKSSRLLRFRESERPIGFQFFGSDPSIMAEAASRSLELNPDFIDINAGCPVKKVISKNSGSALMKDIRLLGRIVGKVRSVSDIPVTVKIRAGWNNESINAIEAAKICMDAGVSAVILHPRTRCQGFGGMADWKLIAELVEKVDIPVIGSGDILAHEDAGKMLRETGARAVMIGRAAMGDPWLFKRVNEYLSGREVSEPVPHSIKLDLALEQLKIFAAEANERFAVMNMRKFFGWYTKGARGGAELRRNIFLAETVEEVTQVVGEFQGKLLDEEKLQDGALYYGKERYSADTAAGFLRRAQA